MNEPAPTLAPDPNLVAEQQQAQNDLIGSLQTKTQGDMASLMARYGTHLALAGVSANSGSNPAAAVAPSFGKAA